MNPNESQIRTVIQRWIEAVDAGDTEGTFADHTDDIVMYDVTGPAEAARGIDAYRGVWDQFLAFQRGDAAFELRSVDVTAGDDIAFAHALLYCAPRDTPDIPERRLRITFGLRKVDDRWLIAHEHHSGPDYSGADAEQGESQIRDIYRQWADSTTSADLDALMQPIADNIVSYEHESPLQYRGVDQVRVARARGLEFAPEAIFEVPDLQIVVQGDLGVSWGLNRMSATPDTRSEHSWSRGTRVFRRGDDGSWRMVHQHVSFPMDLQTGQADTELQP